MAAVATLLASGSSAMNFGTGAYTTPAFTPTAGDLLYIECGVTDNNVGSIAANLTIADNRGTHLTYNVAVTAGQVISGGGSQQRSWWAVDAAGGSMTLTFDCGTADIYCYKYMVYRCTGVDTASPIGTSITGFGGNGGNNSFTGAKTLTLPVAPASTSIVIAAVHVNSNPSSASAVTPGAGWTEDAETSSASIDDYMESMQRGGSTSTSVSWSAVQGAAQTYSGSMMAAEIKVGASIPTLAGLDANHAHAADNVVLTGIPVNITVQAANHAHAADNVPLGGVQILVVQDGVHAHAADNVGLTLPAPGYTDDFNRANGGLGAAWASGGTSLSIVSNQAHPPGIGDVFERFETDLGTPDHYCEADVFLSGGSDYMVVNCRRNSTAVNSDCYQGLLNPDGVHVEIGRNSGGNYTVLANPTATFAGGTPPNKLRLETQGTAIRLYLNGALVASATDSVITTGNYAGLNTFAASGAWFDNFACGPLIVSTTLVVANGTHGHVADNVVLSLAGSTLTVQDALEAHVAEAPTLTQLHILVVQSALHDHAAQQVGFFSGTYPVSRSGRKFIDQRGNVYLWKTFASWSMSQHLTNAQITTALQGVANLGFTCVTVAPWGVNKQSSDNTPLNNAAGQAFWTGTPISSSFGPAWSSMDWVMQECYRLNLTVAFSIFLSYSGTGTTIYMINAGTTACYNYGQALVARYPAAQYPNVIWHVMADFQFDYGADPSTQLDAIFHGIRDAETAAGAPHHLLLAEPSQPNNSGYRQWISQEGVSGYRWCLLDANSFYEYKGDSVVQFDLIYNQAGSTSYPCVDVEPPYVNSGNFGGNFNQQMRERVCCDYIRGSIGINFSNEYWWPMTKTGDLTPAVPFSTVMASLTDTAVVEASYAQPLVELVKDTSWAPDSGTFLKTGLGSGDTQAGSGFSNTVAMVYFPTSRTVVVDTTVLAGTGSCRLRWWDPTSGNYTAIATEARNASRTVSYPSAHSDGQNDWVLVVDLPDMIVASATHAHTAANVVLSVSTVNLVVADGVHAHVADNVVLYPVPNLVVQAAAHAHTADNVALVVDLVAQAAVHAHTAVNVALGVDLVLQAAFHAETADNVALGIDLVVQHAVQVQLADNVAITTQVALVVADAAHVHLADTITMSAVPALSVQDGLHNHVATTILLTAIYDLLVQAGLHGHVADNVTLTAVVPPVDLVVGSTLHTTTSDDLVLTHTIVVQNALHAQVADSLTIGVGFVVQSAHHNHTATRPLLSGGGDARTPRLHDLYLDLDTSDVYQLTTTGWVLQGKLIPGV